MANFFIAYDLNKAGQNYDGLIEQIKELDYWAHVQKSLWYVKTELDSITLFNKLRPYLDNNDSLAVIDAKDAVYWNTICDKDFIKSLW